MNDGTGSRWRVGCGCGFIIVIEGTDGGKSQPLAVDDAIVLGYNRTFLLVLLCGDPVPYPHTFRC
jgi:hypothetical protein